MPWPTQHKVETRRRILDAAAAAFRAEGIAAVGVADIMARAGLTHGGFYAHFASKEELLAEALTHAGRQTRAELGKVGPGPDDTGPSATGPAGLRALIDGYLSPGHRAHPERGCPIAAIAPEVSRASPPVRRRLAAGIRARLDQLRGLLPSAEPDPVRDRKAVAALACMVGGIVLARGLGEEEGLKLLESCREFLRSALDAGEQETAPGRPPRRSSRPRVRGKRSGARRARET